MEIGTRVYHPCNSDTLEFKVVCVRKYEDHNQYELEAVHNVGAQGKVMVLVSDIGGRLRYLDCLRPDDDASERGLDGFIDGEYFTSKAQAQIAFYETQESLSSASVNKFKRLYENQLASHERLVKIIREAREQLTKGASPS